MAKKPDSKPDSKPEKPEKRDKDVQLIFVINGEDVPVSAKLNQPLAEARNHALTTSNNTGRPLDEWEIRDANGVILPSERKVEEFQFVDGTRLFCTLQIGAGGS